jgi:hypothetical protein
MRRKPPLMFCKRNGAASGLSLHGRFSTSSCELGNGIQLLTSIANIVQEHVLYLLFPSNYRKSATGRHTLP